MWCLRDVYKLKNLLKVFEWKIEIMFYKFKWTVYSKNCMKK